MSDQIDDLIREIAVKHGVAVSRDDPILILQTINSRLMQDSAKAQQEMLQRYKEEMEVISNTWSAEAKNKAEKILNAALAASKKAMADQMGQGAREAAQTIHNEIESALSGISLQLRETRKLARLNVFAAVMSLFAAALAAWVVLH
ncbi:MAG: conjugal transfer protein TraM [Alphaproteobacteria bacterium]|nr:conjugal transfer protein TraM [Alphaproteobacteria bacterium]